MQVETLAGLGRQEKLVSTESEGQLKTLYLVNTRLWMAGLRQKYQREITMDSVPDEEWSMLKNYGYVWFMGIYKPSEASQQQAKKYTHQYIYALPDIDPEKDVTASPFAIPEYSPNQLIAKDWDEWDRMVEKLHKRGVKVIVDFVPNHTALDHPWAKTNPEYYIQGTPEQYAANPSFYHQCVDQIGQIQYLAHGKDPNFPEWSDTLQLNYARPIVQEEMKKVLLSLADHADGVRCDMAMLLNPETFLRTWEWCLAEDERQYTREHKFWQEAIPETKNYREKTRGGVFEFFAEAYWDKDELQKYFDGIYNDDFYKHLKRVSGGEPPYYLRSHVEYLIGHRGQGCHDVVYVENHDEERVAQAMGDRFSKAAAVLVGMIPDSIFLVNQGQEEGWKIRPPMQVNRYPNEQRDADLARFYDDLLTIRRLPLFQNGEWKMAQVESGDPNLISVEVTSGGTRAIICVNMSRLESGCGITRVGEKVEIYNLSEGEYCQPDETLPDNIGIKLAPAEVKIIYLKHSENQMRTDLETVL